MKGNRKEEGRVCSTYFVPVNDKFSRDSPEPSENRLIAFLKNAKSVPGFETGSHGQNAVALPLVPPPLPLTVAS